MTQHAYGSAFMGVTSLSRASAERIVPLILRDIAVGSVADFGCALGTWLCVWRESGVADVVGVDGDYLKSQAIEIAPDVIRFADLSKPIDLGRRFDLVQSLEVAEHLPPAAAEVFVDNLTRHGDLILFSAAPPGQGGEFHINERPYTYWRELFAARGYVMLDWIRPLIRDESDIRYWYRFNTFMYARSDAVDRLPAAIRKTLVPRGRQVADISPVWFRFRKIAVQLMPTIVSNSIAAALSRLRTIR